MARSQTVSGADTRPKKRTKAAKIVISPSGALDTRIVALFRLCYGFAFAVTVVGLARIIGAAQMGFFTHVPQEWWLMLIGSAFMASAAAFMEVWYGGQAARMEEKRIRRRLLTDLWQAPPLKEERDASALITLMTDNTERVTEYRQVYFGATMAAILLPFGVLAYVALRIDALIGLVLMVMCPLIPVLIGLFMRFFRKTSAHSRRARARLSGQYLDALRNLTTIRLYGAGPRIQKHLERTGEENRGAIMKLLAGNQIVIIVLDGLFSLLLICMAGALVYLRYRVGAITFDQALSVLFLTTLLLEPLVQVAGFFYIGMGGMASARAIARFIKENENHTDKSAKYNSTNKNNTVENNADEIDAVGEINAAENTASETKEELASTHSDDQEALKESELVVHIKDLEFSYGREEVLTDINLDVKQGERVAIIGRSGQGKSTLLNILSGALPVPAGSVWVEGEDIAFLSRAEIAQKSARVAQKTWLFTGTIKENLALAAPEAREEDMWEALRKAHLDQEIRSFADGLLTDIGEGGGRLSGGQAQRLSFARALLSGRQLMLLDEPTSAIDRASEEALAQALHELDSSWTVIMVTHRRALMAHATRVLELKEGALNAVNLTETIEGKKGALA